MDRKLDIKDILCAHEIQFSEPSTGRVHLHAFRGTLSGTNEITLS